MLILLSALAGADAAFNSEVLRSEGSHDVVFETKPARGFSVCVGDHSGKSNALPENLLCWGVYSLTNSLVPLRVAKRPEYGYRADMYGPSNQVVRKTVLGRRIGTQFLNLGPSSFTNGIETIPLRVLKKESGLLPYVLFRPSDIFIMEKPGSYRLRLEFQLFSFPGKPGAREPQLIRFEPLDIPMVKAN